jgi:hypothetical protein
MWDSSRILSQHDNYLDVSHLGIPLLNCGSPGQTVHSPSLPIHPPCVHSLINRYHIWSYEFAYLSCVKLLRLFQSHVFIFAFHSNGSTTPPASPRSLAAFPQRLVTAQAMIWICLLPRKAPDVFWCFLQPAEWCRKVFPGCYSSYLYEYVILQHMSRCPTFLGICGYYSTIVIHQDWESEHPRGFLVLLYIKKWVV